MSHPNAKLNEYGRLLLVSRTEAGCPRWRWPKPRVSHGARSQSCGADRCPFSSEHPPDPLVVVYIRDF
jgi:hypothetical protein